MTNIKITKTRQTRSEPSTTSDHTRNLTINERAAQTKTRLEAAKLTKNTQNAQTLDKIIGVIQILREVSPSMTLNQALVFLEVAKRDGVEALAVRQQFELPQSSMSQVVAALSSISYQKKDGKPVDGYDLVVQSNNFDDGRAKNLHLTEKGKKITEKIISKING